MSYLFSLALIAGSLVPVEFFYTGKDGPVGPFNSPGECEQAYSVDADAVGGCYSQREVSDL